MERMNRMTRRRFLRGAVVGGGGLLAACIVGCGDDEESGGEQTASPTTDAATRTAGATATPAATDVAALRWRQIEMSGGLPHPRTDHSLVSDGSALLLFGGRTNGAPLGDLWSYDLATEEWTQLADGPPDRFGHNAVYDAAGKRMLVFGGQAGGSFFNDVWSFDGTAWTELPLDSRPAERYGAASALDATGRLVVSHGFTNQGRFDDTWAFGAAGPWADVSPGAARPVKRCLVRGVWDGKRDRFLIFGGQTDGTPFLGDLWALDANGWTEITSEPKPSPRNFYAMVATDSAVVALFGGNTDEPGPANDLWFLDTANDTWTQVEAEGEAPSPRYGHDAVWLADSRKMVVFGGHDNSGDVNDLWELTVPG